MKRIVLLLGLLMPLIMISTQASAQVRVYKVTHSHQGRGGWGQMGLWSDKELGATKITVDDNKGTLVVEYAKREPDTYRLRGEFASNSYPVVAVHERMSREGWDVLDITAIDDYNHDCMVRFRTHKEQGLTQFIIYCNRCDYGYEVTEITEGAEATEGSEVTKDGTEAPQAE